MGPVQNQGRSLRLPGGNICAQGDRPGGPSRQQAVLVDYMAWAGLEMSRSLLNRFACCFAECG